MRCFFLISLILLMTFSPSEPTVCLSSEPTDAAPAAVEPRAMVEQVLVHLEFLEISRTEMAARGLDIQKHDAAVRQILADQRAVKNGERELDAAAAGQRMADLQASLHALKKALVVKRVAEPTIVTVYGRPVHFRVGEETKDESGKLGFKGTEWHCDVEKRADGRIGLTSHGSVDSQAFQARMALHSGELGVANSIIVVKDRDGSAGNNRAGEEFEYLMLLRPEIVAPPPPSAFPPVAASLPKTLGHKIIVRAELLEVSPTKLGQLGCDFVSIVDKGDAKSSRCVPIADVLEGNAPPETIDALLDTLQQNNIARSLAKHELLVVDGQSGHVKVGSEFSSSVIAGEGLEDTPTLFLGSEGTYSVDLKQDYSVQVEFHIATWHLLDRIKPTEGKIIPARRIIESGMTLKLGVPGVLGSGFAREAKALFAGRDDTGQPAVSVENEKRELLIVLRAELAEENQANVR